MRILVTGGAGFIGSNFARYVLSTSDDTVTIYDALTYAGHRSSIADVADSRRLSFVQGDICDRAMVTSSMLGHDAVVHFAAETHVDRSIDSSRAFVRTNCDGTDAVCEAARHAEIARVVHVSTDEVYGSIDKGSFAEDAPLTPRSPYAASKAASDLLALSHHTTHGLPVVVTRSSNNFGPYQLPEKVVPLFVTNLLDGLKVPLYGDGGNVRDWCHVSDNCRAIDLVLRSGVPGEIYNVGAGNELTNRQLTSMLLGELGMDLSWIEHVADRPGHDRRYSICTEKVRRLGWHPSRGLAEAIAETVGWYRDNRSWWEPLRGERQRLGSPSASDAPLMPGERG